MNNTIGFFLLFISWLIPLHFLPWVSWHNEAMAFTAGLMLAIPLLNKYSIDIPRAFFILIFLQLIASLQLFLGYFYQRSDYFIISLYLVLCMISLIRGSHDGRNIILSNEKNITQIDFFASAIAAGAIISAFVALVQIFNVFENSGLIARMPQLRRSGGNLAQPNHLGSLLLMGLGSFIHLHSRSVIRLPLLIFASLVICLAIATTGSRTAFLGIFIFALWTFLGNFKKIVKLQKQMILLLLLSAIFLFISWPTIMVQLGFFDAGSVVNLEKGLRPIVWSQLSYAISQKPWLGWGIRQVSSAHNSVADIFSISEPFSYAHNIIIELAIGIGIPLTAIFVTLSAIWIIKKIKGTSSITEWYCMQILLVLILHSLLEFPYAYAYFLVPGMYAIGVLDALHKNTKTIEISKNFTRVIFITCSVIGIFICRSYLDSEADFRTSRFQALKISTNESTASFNEFVFFPQLQTLNNATKLTITSELSNEDLNNLKKTALQFPWPATQSRYALALALTGDIPEASRQLQVIRAMHGEAIYLSISSKWRDMATGEYENLSKITYFNKPRCIYWPCEDL